ncbi:hypothetical protein NB037_18130 [Rathayibacter sp. ZW T2_19]|uniref:Uncharacterized protein n=1 Tax=Rathayibacter rubneri TaxID=2950106 RepID=A0A9X2IVB0_9MICO|nr:hypothetical protein [Rathayibacter rubneri]MCM6764338.1 hypothetical protein [Rathayibacter rubneri]
MAVDQAGFTLVDVLERIPLPPDSQIVGSLLGDLQSVDATGTRTFYYLRPGEDTVLPKWIANLARASHALAAGHVYVVVSSYADELVRSCTDAGAGLLRLSEDGVFEMVVDYTETAPKSLEDATSDRITAIRRSMERRLEMIKVDIDARVSASASILSGMENDAAEQYLNKFEAEYRAMDSWGTDMSKRLDGLGGRSTPAEIAEVADLVDEGPRVPVERPVR